MKALRPNRGWSPMAFVMLVNGSMRFTVGNKIPHSIATIIMVTSVTGRLTRVRYFGSIDEEAKILNVIGGSIGGSFDFLCDIFS